MLAHHRLPAAKIIDHSIASSAYRPHEWGIFYNVHVALSFAVKSAGRCDLVFSVEETAGVFTTNLSSRDVCFELHKTNYHRNELWALLNECILTILIGLSVFH